MSKILSLKYHLLLFWLISLFTGFLFAVVIDSTPAKSWAERTDNSSCRRPKQSG